MDGATPPTAGARRSSRATAALVVALVAFGLSLYGSLLAERHLPGSRLNEAWLSPGTAFAQSSESVRGLVAFAGYGLPLLLGVAGAVVGGRAMRALGTDPADRIHHLKAVFAVMIGGLAAVVSACMLLAVYGWDHVPHWYTT